MIKLFAKYLIFFQVFLYGFVASAQEYRGKPEGSARYYIDLKANDRNTVYQIVDGITNIKYFDEYGERAYLALNIYDWKHENVANYHLNKLYGLNHYAIEMEWLQDGQTYSLEATDEKGKQYTVAIKGSGELKLDPPKAEIVVNPVKLSCESLEGNMVEFYAAVSGGRPPYEIQWIVLNGDRSELLYAPRYEKITDPGKGMVILVNKPPSYHVLLQVTDVCGNEAKRIVSITCNKKKEVYHSIFIEPVRLPGWMKHNKNR